MSITQFVVQQFTCRRCGCAERLEALGDPALRRLTDARWSELSLHSLPELFERPARPTVGHGWDDDPEPDRANRWEGQRIALCNFCVRDLEDWLKRTPGRAAA